MNLALIAARKRKIVADWKRKEAKYQKFEDMISKLWAGGFRQELPVVLRVLSKHFGSIAQASALTAANRYATIEVSIRSELTKIKKPLVTKLKTAYKQAGTTMAADSAVGAGFRFPGFPKATQTWLESYVPQITGEITEATCRKILKQIVKGVELGESQHEIAARVRRVYEMTWDRANLIAKVETGKIAAKSEYDMFQAMPVDKSKLTKIWHNAQDDNVRDLHQIEGQARKFAKRFSNDLQYPRDPSGSAENVINCRCWLEWHMA